MESVLGEKSKHEMQNDDSWNCVIYHLIIDMHLYAYEVWICFCKKF